MSRGARILGQYIAVSDADIDVLDLKSDKASEIAKNIFERYVVKVNSN